MLKIKHNFKSALVALIGRANAGKSTFLNNVMQIKVSIVSPVAQTTRRNIRAILTTETEQIVFIDTPGIHISERAYNQNLVRTAVNSIDGVDIILLIVDSSRDFGAEDRQILDLLKRQNVPIIVALNKIDLTNSDNLRNKIYLSELPQATILNISALAGLGIVEVLNTIVANAPLAPPLYPLDIELDEHFYETVADFIREQLFYHLTDELPHHTEVEISDIIETDDHFVLIKAYLVVKKQSQKNIIIGKNATKIQAIRKTALKTISRDLYQNERKIKLELQVKLLK